MTIALQISGFLLLASLALGLWRVWLGPSAADRMLAIQLFGTNGVALLLVLSMATDRFALLDIALVLMLLAVLTTVAFVSRVWPPDPEYQKHQDHDDDHN